MHQVALINITKNGSDAGVYLNGEYITAVDPGCGENFETAREVAANLAAALGVELTEIDHRAHKEWQWDEIIDDLVEQGKIIR